MWPIALLNKGQLNTGICKVPEVGVRVDYGFIPPLANHAMLN
jgi:hypothetical protein